MASQQQSSYTPVQFRDAWRTPPGVFNYLNSTYNFDIDLAADEENARCQTYFTERYNALDFDWYRCGQSGWCNPPYSRQQAFIDKAIEQAKRGFITVMLIPCFNGQAYWQKIYDSGAHVTNIIGRLSFLSPCDYVSAGKQIRKGDPAPGNTSGSCIIQFGGNRVLPLYLLRENMS